MCAQRIQYCTFDKKYICIILNQTIFDDIERTFGAYFTTIVFFIIFPYSSCKNKQPIEASKTRIDKIGRVNEKKTVSN